MTKAQHVPPGNLNGDEKRDASLTAMVLFLVSCLLASFAGELTNVQHADTGTEARRLESPVADASVLATFFNGRVICSCSSHGRLFPRRRDQRVLPSELRTGKANGGETARPPPPLIPGPAGGNSLAAAADAEEPVHPNAGFREAKNANSPQFLPLEPVRAGVGEGKNAKAPVPLERPGPADNDRREAKTPNPPLAVDPMGVSGCSVEVKNARARLRVGPAAGCPGKARNAKLPLLPL